MLQVGLNMQVHSTIIIPALMSNCIQYWSLFLCVIWSSRLWNKDFHQILFPTSPPCAFKKWSVREGGTVWSPVLIKEVVWRQMMWNALAAISTLPMYFNHLLTLKLLSFWRHQDLVGSDQLFNPNKQISSQTKREIKFCRLSSCLQEIQTVTQTLDKVGPVSFKYISNCIFPM